MPLQPSPSSSSLDRVKYDVFLSFRGFDTRIGFTGNLYKALKDKGICTFFDDRELKGGEEITPTLLKAIEDSRIAIIVFSENYAQSSFCLDELVHIIECSKAKDRLVLPIFYGVEPTHLRHHTGSYGEALAKHEAKFRNNKETCIHNMERLQKWKTALNQAANLSGHHFKLDGKEYEYDFIGKIVDFVSKKINRTPLYVHDCRVGLEPRVLQVKSLLNVESDDGVCMVGIHGMGGIGKTTLAREIYNSIFNHFEASCFLDDVRQNTHQNLQKTLLHQTIREKDIEFGSVSKGMSEIKQRLHTKKVLVILDDVDDLKQLEALVGGRDWFGPGSRIIITTRDLHLLKRHGIEKTYEVGELNMDEALELLSWKAFGNNKVDPSDKYILMHAFTCATGLPLALEVVGSNLFGKKIEEWEPILARYKRNSCKDIQETLSVSFDALEKDEQSVFLDIACCFNDSKLKDVERILCAHYGYCIKYLIKVLVEKSLIKITDHGNVELHDLIEDMGKDIVQRESPKEPGGRSRLWSPKDIVTVLEDNTGTSNIEIICLDSSYSRSWCKVDWNGEAFKKMRNLKTLIVCDWSHRFHFSEGPQHFPNRLRVLEWTEYPFKVIPSIFLNKRMENMTILIFDGCDLLTDTPNVSNLPNLEVFSFRHCVNLITIHESVGFLSKLKILNVKGCKKLMSFPPLKKLPSLQVLELSYCHSLKNFPEILGEIKNITKIDIKYTSIKELPSSFQNLIGLCNLELRGGVYSIRVPISILLMLNLSRVIFFSCQLLPIQNDNITSMVSKNIKVLHLLWCYLSDEILATVLKLVVNVEELYLDGNYFTILPKCIEECGFLRKLSFADCSSLRKIEGIPPNLKYLNASSCNWLTSFWHSSMLLNKKLHEDGGTDFRFPIGIDERIPEWFEHQSMGTSISFWFRKNVPSIALFVNFATIHEEGVFSLRASLRIDGNEYPLHLGVNYRMSSSNTYLFDVRLQDRGLESQLGGELLENKWIDAIIEFYKDSEDQAMRSKFFLGSGVIESGIHVFKQKTNMEDIRFTDPYEGKRKFDEG